MITLFLYDFCAGDDREFNIHPDEGNPQRSVREKQLPAFQQLLAVQCLTLNTQGEGLQSLLQSLTGSSDIRELLTISFVNKLVLFCKPMRVHICSFLYPPTRRTFIDTSLGLVLINTKYLLLVTERCAVCRCEARKSLQLAVRFSHLHLRLFQEKTVVSKQIHINTQTNT